MNKQLPSGGDKTRKQLLIAALKIPNETGTDLQIYNGSDWQMAHPIRFMKTKWMTKK